jgi:hypothetical protein
MYSIGVGNKYAVLLRESEAQADAELNDTNIPNGIPPFDFRRWFIARTKARSAISFLQNRKMNFEKMYVRLIHDIDEQERNIKNRQG